jgi:DNA repair protein RadA/Sms
MKKTFFCSECGHESWGWLGMCPSCKSWNTFTDNKELIKADSYSFKKLNEINVLNVENAKTSLSEFNRVLGGGIPRGAFLLLSGEPGAGKSTLILSLLRERTYKKSLYISGEESYAQIKSRCERIKIEGDDLILSNETDYKKILDLAKYIKPEIIIIDSIQMLKAGEAIGVGQEKIKEITIELLEFGKKQNTTFILIGHITKAGLVAGPKYIEHMVDITLKLEVDKVEGNRILSSKKNRFGSTDEVGVFEMKANGFRDTQKKHTSIPGLRGRTFAGIIKGNRLFRSEVQTLYVSNTQVGSTYVNGHYESKRLNMLLAIIEKYLKIRIKNKEVYLNIIGHKNYLDNQVDLAVAASLLASYYGIVIPVNYIFMGEIGLSGEIRISKMLKRIKGEEIIITGIDNKDNESYNYIQCANIQELQKVVVAL